MRALICVKTTAAAARPAVEMRPVHGAEDALGVLLA